MLHLSNKLVEHTSIRYTLEKELELQHARWLRGAIAREVDRPEFHHHASGALVYQHPLIRYDICGREALIHGLAEGALLLRGIPNFESFRLGAEVYRILAHGAQANRLELGPCPEPTVYHFQTPYLALNQQNHIVWQQSHPFERRRLLERIVVGNLLSLSKAVGLNVAERLDAEVDLAPDCWHELKPGVRLLGFQGAVQVNFRLPERWGIGKSSARGFGTLMREENGHG